jgi:ketosteroid isomerase-like protein
MDTDAVRQAVDEGNREFGAATARKDYAGMAALYTDNAKVMPPNEPIVSGKEAIEKYWRSAATELGLTEVTLKTVDLEIAGDTAYEVGEADMKLSVLSFIGGSVAKTKYLVVWRRGDDGQWRRDRNIWNNTTSIETFGIKPPPM